MGNAPDNVRGAAAKAAVHGKCHRKETASEIEHGGIAQGNLQDAFEMLVLQVRVKRWGKSPPLVWQQTRHGKPRVVQGQIGGESRPGSLEPSGRLLEPWCESRPRGMIAAMQSQDYIAQNPAYRLARSFFDDLQSLRRKYPPQILPSMSEPETRLQNPQHSFYPDCKEHHI